MSELSSSPPLAATGYLLEERRTFSESMLWDLQRRYFSDAGAAAWRDGDVPQYVTSNPRIADAYAEIAFALRRDLQARSPGCGPVTLCELGAGSGRFAFHFLQRLTLRCREAGFDPASEFRYVLSDYAQSNLDAWRAHPKLTPFFRSGLLDLALFDVSVPKHLRLQISGTTISAGTLDEPLVVVANYLFDSVPQDLFYLHDGKCRACRVSLACGEDPNALSAAELLARLEYRYDPDRDATPTLLEPALQQMLDDYAAVLSDTFLLFPAAGLRCLRHLQGFSKQGLLLLSADKGDHRLDDLRGKPPPGLVRHGSFSLPVNFHAFAVACEQDGGLALLPDAAPFSLSVACLLFLPDADLWHETRSAYRRSVAECGPDDFYAVLRQVRSTISEMSVGDLLACLRLSLDDAHLFARFIPRLMELKPQIVPQEKEAISEAADRVWERYFPLGEDQDLAYAIATLLYVLDEFHGALNYFERSNALYGPHTGALFNMAACCGLLGRREEAADLLRIVLEADPNNFRAAALLEDYSR